MNVTSLNHYHKQIQDFIAVNSHLIAIGRIESRAYLEYKKRTVAQLKKYENSGKLDDDDDEDGDDESEEDDEEGDAWGEGHDGRKYGENLNYFAYDERLDKDSDESDSFDNYDDDI